MMNDKNVIFDNYFFYLNSSINKAYTDLKFCWLSLQTHLEIIVSQILDLGPIFVYHKKRETFYKLSKNDFLRRIKQKLGPKYNI